MTKKYQSLSSTIRDMYANDQVAEAKEQKIHMFKTKAEAEKKANYKELQSILIDVQEVDGWEFDDFPLTTNGEENVKRTNKQR